MKNNIHAWLAVSACGRDWMLASGSVIEIVAAPHIQQLPDAPACVAGVLNFRSTPAAAIDLNAALVPGASAVRRNCAVVFELSPGGTVVSFLADTFSGLTNSVIPGATNIVDPCELARSLGIFENESL
ncbi:MAG: chemotaxis protein CheW [Spirochaetia bacterium]|nr:chemotaxis protein CheW [Spirochaetia bacterium]